ncbi:MAG: ATP-binding cassette domain-containing protein [Planctomycetota bacterium]|nr:ATP-binding cassette domain-containing protein [Planctomycetota bacterium]MDA1143303.1 ATP-binding cassette domain-containing protein [Planctomycetota bacterium]
MPLITLKGACFAYSGTVLLDELDFQIDSGQRIGLLGRNGAGKSTLLKIIHGALELDSGSIWRQQGLKTALLDQEVPQNTTGSLVEVVARGLGRPGEAVARYHVVSQKIETEGSDELFAELQTLQDTLAEDDGWELLSRVERVLSMMLLDADAEFSVLSAGMKRRVMLARALVTEPDILLFDEPTNHLDIEAIRWLEDFLSRIETPLVFVTHDRAFLRRLANRIVEINLGKLFDWSCDYDTFLERKDALLKDEDTRQALFEKRLAQEEVWIRQGVKARRTRNEGRVKRLQAMREEQRNYRRQVGKVRMQIQDGVKSGRQVVRGDNLSFGYGDELIIKDFSTQIMRGDKIGILGPNGVGKTTLIRLLLGEIEPLAGKLKHGTKLEVSYFDQLRMQLDEDKTIKQNLSGDADQVIQNGEPRHVYGYAQDFLFSPDRSRSLVKYLSGGERNRLLLAKLFLQPANVLVLDEPTNDLDTETLELLEELLLDFEGTILLVSHDRAFLDNVATSTLVFEGDGHIGEYSGGYEDWSRHNEAAMEAAEAKEKKSSPKPQPERRSRRVTYKEQKELKALPSKIGALESEQQSLHGAMSDPSFYKKSGDEIAATTSRLEEIEAELGAAYARWEVLEQLDG